MTMREFRAFFSADEYGTPRHNAITNFVMAEFNRAVESRLNLHKLIAVGHKLEQNVYDTAIRIFHQEMTRLPRKSRKTTKPSSPPSGGCTAPGRRTGLRSTR